MAGVGVAAAAWPFIDQMNPSSAALALASIEVDISTIQPGQQVVYKWRGHPLFVRRRTPKEIAESKAVDVSSLPDPLAENANLPSTAPATDEAFMREYIHEWKRLMKASPNLAVQREP